MGNVLSIENLNVTYVNKTKRVMAVRDASLSIDRGDSLGLVGESGSGKSTLAMAILGLLPKQTTEITGKAIFLENKDLIFLLPVTLFLFRNFGIIEHQILKTIHYIV